MKKSLLLFVILIIGYTFSSCSKFDAIPSSSPIQFDASYLNKQIQLIADPRLNSFRTKDSVGLQLIYNTSNDIIFPNDFNLRIFVVENNNWLEIYEEPMIRPENNIVLSPKIPLSYGQLVSFFPQLNDLNKEYHMRAYIFGDMNTQTGLQKVAAYVDFLLKP